VRERVDDHDVVALVRGDGQCVDQRGRLERHQLQRVEAELVGVLGCAAPLGVDEGNPLAELGAHGKRCVGLPRPAGPGQRDTSLGLFLARVAEGQVGHLLPLRGV
jgi:hypothetical protein